MRKKEVINDAFNKAINAHALEQSINYISYTSKSNTSFAELKYKGSFQMAKAAYLDGVGYLHASFTDSPVIRFPMLGNSIKGELSFFKPETINNTKWNKFQEIN